MGLFREWMYHFFDTTGLETAPRGRRMWCCRCGRSGCRRWLCRLTAYEPSNDTYLWVNTSELGTSTIIPSMMLWSWQTTITITKCLFESSNPVTTAGLRLSNTESGPNRMTSSLERFGCGIIPMTRTGSGFGSTCIIVMVGCVKDVAHRLIGLHLSTISVRLGLVARTSRRIYYCCVGRATVLSIEDLCNKESQIFY